MSMPFYVSPEQLMKDRADFARKGIARGRSLVVLQFADGVLFVTENPSQALHKVSEIYDRIAFAAVGRYNEFENLRIAGVRLADMRGYAYDRRDVTGRGLANAYAQTLGTIFSSGGEKPYEVELFVAEIGDTASADQIYRLTYEGRVADEHGYGVMGGDAETVTKYLEEHYVEGAGLDAALQVAVAALGHSETEDRVIPTSDLEVAVLDRTRAQPRKFARILPVRLDDLLGERGPAIAGPPEGGAPVRSPARPRPTDIPTTRRTRPTRPAATWTPSRTPSPASPRSRHRATRRPADPSHKLTTVPNYGGNPAGSVQSPRKVHSVDRRIFGIENEYGVTCTFKGQRRLSPDEVARYLFRKVVSWGRSSNVFLRNGARLYLDVGSHPEYATPECDDVVELVTHDKAGERVLEGLLLDAEQRLHDEGISGEIYLFKNNTDSAGNSYGCHENYLVGRAGEFSRLADVLIPFLVTRQIVVGAGKVTQSPRGASYSVSQRAEHIWEGVSSATTRSRPIINTRDEPHADAEKYRRLHVIVGDSNMSETTTMLKVASCDLVLRMIEEGVVMRDLTMENPIRAIREISHDVTGRRKVRLANGREASALEIQGEYLGKARDFVDRRGISTPTIEMALDLWERGLKAIESDDLGLVDREIDWVIKWKLIDRYRAKHGLPLGHARIAQLDLAYHDIHRGRGLYYLLEKRGAVARVTTDLKVFEAKSVPAADHAGPAPR